MSILNRLFYFSTNDPLIVVEKKNSDDGVICIGRERTVECEFSSNETTKPNKHRQTHIRRIDDDRL